tara:strand:- start:2538 stop:2882 length:345 start_codon:yes stop_codon:yes gene_type:complete
MATDYTKTVRTPHSEEQNKFEAEADMMRHKWTYIKVIGQFNDKVTEMVKEFAKTYAYRMRRDQGKTGIKVAREGMTQVLPVSQSSRYADPKWNIKKLQYGVIINTAGQTHGNPE